MTYEPLCECGDEKDLHTILPTQTFCRAPRCTCESFVERTPPPLVKDCPRCEGKGRWSEIDKTDGGSLFIVCPDCGGSGRMHANGESLVREFQDA